MKHTIHGLIILMLTLLTLAPAHSAELPASLDAAGQSLALNGSGTRSKLMLKLYNAGLYLTAASSDAAGIVSADQPMAIRLAIISDMITAEKMESATAEGFDNATAGNTAPIAAEIEAFLKVVRQGIKNGDIYDLVYTPDGGTAVSKNGQPQTRIAGLPFKQALFGIWLGEKPAQEKLKKGLLGM